MKEWKILEQSLPESIYVRVYEQRIDLMRAVIVGAAGTPYHDGLFFFDIAFPSDYPKHPPKLNFRSFGHRINPNLYNTGKVCLSLLNTWHGRKRELWDPCESTILQVLLSIQGLVLNEKPFYNEPGIESFGRFVFDVETRSRAYSDNAFVFTLDIASHLLRKPPRNFEDFVSAFFRQRAGSIMEACDEYMNGRVRVGYFGCVSGSDLSSSSKSSKMSKIEVSQGFREAMMGVVPRLVQAFRENGASVVDPDWKWEVSQNLVQVEEYEDIKSGKWKGNKGSVMFKKVVEKIKKAFRWKKNRGKNKRSEGEISRA
uniref:Ubiquitin carrier protein E2 23 n=2 Tax=Cajanus cajan TaxID=3821 RepID=A0A151SSV9_CAJCA|nr:putative ubiquitin carrier protein E2 23 [Cajanus cajan]